MHKQQNALGVTAKDAGEDAASQAVQCAKREAEQGTGQNSCYVDTMNPCQLPSTACPRSVF